MSLILTVGRRKPTSSESLLKYRRECLFYQPEILNYSVGVSAGISAGVSVLSTGDPMSSMLAKSWLVEERETQLRSRDMRPPSLRLRGILAALFLSVERK